MDLNNISENILSLSHDPRSKYMGMRLILSRKSLINESDDSILNEQGNVIKKFFKDENMLIDSNQDFYDLNKIINGLPEGGYFQNQISHQCNFDLLSSISLSKGCYIGQELIARTQYKGVIRQRIFPFILNTDIQKGILHLPLSKFSNVHLNKINSNIHKNTSILNLGVDFLGENGKRVGKLLEFNSKFNIGLGMFRLEHVFNNKNDDVSCSLLGLDGNNYEITPFLPPWWEDKMLNLETGKYDFVN